MRRITSKLMLTTQAVSTVPCGDQCLLASDIADAGTGDARLGLTLQTVAMAPQPTGWVSKAESSC
jgi:hypothetical protein